MRRLTSYLSRHIPSKWNQNIALTKMLVWQDLAVPYSGQFLGAFWSIGHPLFLMVLYAFVFSIVIKAKIGGTYEMPLNYTIYILSGLAPWLCFQQALQKSCVSITSNARAIYNLTFPLSALPISSAVSSLVILLIGACFIALITLFTEGALSWLYLLLPFVVFIQALAMIGFALFLSAITVFVKDIKDIISIACITNMFITPIVYLPGSIPTPFKIITYLNPFSYMILVYRDIFYFGRFESYYAWPLFIFFSLWIYFYGLKVFKRLKGQFSLVLT